MSRRISLALTAGLLAAPSLATASEKSQLCTGAGIDNCANPENNLIGRISDITSTLLLIAGAVAVIVIIFGGIRYVTSTGDPKRIEQAKNTILYAVVGLVVVILAYAIVQFVIKRLT